jgi:hypothetical protein
MYPVVVECRRRLTWEFGLPSRGPHRHRRVNFHNCHVLFDHSIVLETLQRVLQNNREMSAPQYVEDCDRHTRTVPYLRQSALNAGA